MSFDPAAPAGQGEPGQREPAPHQHDVRRWAPWAGGGALLLKTGGVLLKVKGLVSLGTLLVSVLAYAGLYGWRFGTGFVLLIAVHELGHVLALRRLGIRAGLPVFVPFLGAFVRLREAPETVLAEALSALAGPATGVAGALVVAGTAAAAGSGLLRALAFTGLLVNLFNLVPALPLDGGRVAAALHPATWWVALGGLLASLLISPHPVMVLVLVLGSIEAARRWRSRHTAAGRAYLNIAGRHRVLVAGAYLGLVMISVAGCVLTYVPRSL